MADTYADHPGRRGLVPLDQVLKIIAGARQTVAHAQSLSELDRQLDTIVNLKATIIRHLREAFKDQL